MVKHLLTLTLFWTGIASAQSLFVQAVKAELRSAPETNAKSLATLTRGTEVEVLQTQGSWSEVKTGGKQGWCMKLFLSPHKPIGKAALEKELAPSVEKTTRRRISSSYGSAASARGAMSNERSREGREKYKTDYDAVEKIEKEEVSDDEVKAFQKDGKLKGE